MTVDKLRGELRVRFIPYAGLTKVELQMALAYAVGVADNVSGQVTDRSNSPVVAPDPQADTAVDRDPAPPYSGATAQAELDSSPVKTPSMDEDQLRTLELQIQWRRLEAEKYEHEIQLNRQEIELQLKHEERAEREHNLKLQAQQQREREQVQFELRKLELQNVSPCLLRGKVSHSFVLGKLLNLSPNLRITISKHFSFLLRRSQFSIIFRKRNTRLFCRPI